MLNAAKLYVVATPIGNLDDITLRALTVLKEVELIAAEDTRQSKKLLAHYGISTSLYALHAHNERTHSAKIIEMLKNQQSVAYITDAGTPLISDPGAYLVKTVREAGFPVVPIPGACAAIAAMSISGFVSPNFYFEGFLPSKGSHRRQRLHCLMNYECSLVFYESPHRIEESLADIMAVLGDREVILARELTKKYETVLADKLSAVMDVLACNEQQRRGEFVILLAGKARPDDVPYEKIASLLTELLVALPIKAAVAIVSNHFGVGKNDIYKIALELKNKNENG